MASASNTKPKDEPAAVPPVRMAFPAEFAFLKDPRPAFSLAALYPELVAFYRDAYAAGGGVAEAERTRRFVAFFRAELERLAAFVAAFVRFGHPQAAGSAQTTGRYVLALSDQQIESNLAYLREYFEQKAFFWPAAPADAPAQEPPIVCCLGGLGGGGG